MTAPATLVHDPGDHRFTDPGRVVALTAMAEACTRAGLSPTVFDDRTRRPDVCTDPSQYHRWQLDSLSASMPRFTSMESLDRCATDGPCGRRHRHHCADTDRSSRTLAPDAITYVGRIGPVEAGGYHNGHLPFWPRLGDFPLASRLLALIDRSARCPSHRSRLSRRCSPLRRMIRFSLACAGGSAAGTVPSRVRAPRSHGAARSTTLMLWYAGYGAEQFAADEHGQTRYRVITRGGDAFASSIRRCPRTGGRAIGS